MGLAGVKERAKTVITLGAKTPYHIHQQQLGLEKSWKEGQCIHKPPHPLHIIKENLQISVSSPENVPPTPLTDYHLIKPPLKGTGCSARKAPTTLHR